MRLVLILAMVISALVMGLPQPASAHAMPMADCHGMVAPDHQQHDDGDTRLQIAHACSGCALPLAGCLLAPADWRTRLPVAARSVQPAPLTNTGPNPPPPRLS